MSDRVASQSVAVITKGMRRLLVVVLVVISLLVVDSVYLSVVSFVQALTGQIIENAFYQVMFLVHLVLGVLVIVPTLVFGAMHLRRAITRPNRTAVRLGLGLFVTVLLLFISGVALTRGLPWFELKHEIARTLTYWLHVLTPVAAIWLFILHRLVGPRIRWKSGISVAVVSLVLAVAGVGFLHLDFEETVAAADFSPSLAQTAHGGHLKAEALMTNEQCLTCHADVHATWAVSAHRFASFNNPAYAFAVNNTRAKVLERDGDVGASRFCASCHDPVPLFSGLFDDPAIDFQDHPTGQAGLTCVSCHAIQEVNGVRGNGEYTIGLPEQYPFADSNDEFLQWVHGVLLKGRPKLHKTSYLKPFHQTAEFCSTCHKVHLPEELNHYKWLRGQNHYDSFLISGVSGHGVASFYYPQKASTNCNVCHMPLIESDDFAASDFDGSGRLAIHSHQFPAANTAIQAMAALDPSVNDKQIELLQGSLRVDIFGLRIGEDITKPLVAPLRPIVPVLERGKEYLIEVVIRTLRVGHKFTEGTIDSNEVWLALDAKSDQGDVLGRSGGMNADTAAVDPWSHFVNAYVIDREGNRIDRRNAEDIFVKLYDNQIGPGSADVVLYRLVVPDDADVSELTVTVALNYRKFDQNYFALFSEEPGRTNDLPIVTIARDTLTFPVRKPQEDLSEQSSDIAIWERWNDYGIGMLLKPKRVGLRQAELAFKEVVELGRPEGHLNLARVWLNEGRLEEAADALGKAYEGGAYPWSVAWFTALVDKQLGNFEAAIEKFDQLRRTAFEEAVKRGFDFSRDYNLLNQLALSYFELSKEAGTESRRTELLTLAIETYRSALAEDSENVQSHYGLMQVYDRLGNFENATYHRSQHQKYRIDDNAKDRAVNAARQRDPAANHASESIVIYDLHRDNEHSVGAT
ncbi:MAG: multiheme c-type cytochrome [Gammaproteobacteria bacterium]|nr:multiheme c-type cytochrome [Gammaproteobacteria bacterium]